MTYYDIPYITKHWSDKPVQWIILMGWFHIFMKERTTKLLAFGLPYNAGMLSPCNLSNLYIHVYLNATVTKEERIYASVSIVSEIWMIGLYDIIIQHRVSDGDIR